MKVYQITKKNDAPNVFGISLVATPAMESDYVKLSRDSTFSLNEEEKISLSKQNDIKFSEVNKEKKLLLGLVLEPNKLIYRYDQKSKEEYYITVNEETILELAHDYIKNSNQNYSTIEHDGNELDGVTFVEHWIVEDSKIDKSALHGLNFKKGSWVTVAKIDNETIWNDYVKTGKVMGFSIDAMVQLEEVKLNKQEEMSEQKKTLAEFVKETVNEIKMALIPKKEEDVVNTDVSLSNEEGVKEEEVKAEVEVKTTDFDLEAFVSAMKDMGVELSSAVKEAVKPLEETNVALKAEIEALEAKVVELGKQPDSKKIVTRPTQVDLSSMSNLERMKYNQANK